MMFGGNSMAMRAFIIILLIIMLVWILYSLNFSFPNISLKSEDRPKKVESKKSKVASRDNEDDEEEDVEDRSDFGKPISRSLIKSLIKQKFEEKVIQKERKIKPMINFS